MMFSREDLTGKKFGRLTVAGIYAKEGGQRLWLCNCDCGAEAIIVPTGKLKGAHKLSCGCLQREVTARMARTHGLSSTREHKVWDDMKARCYSPGATGYANYGGRGIKVCDRWRDSFESFLEDMGRIPSPKHSLDRINVEGDYEPGNCRWSTWKEQQRNKRTTRYLEVDGVRASLAEHCERRGLRYGTVLWRLQAGIPPDIALSVPNLYAARRSAARS